MPDKGDGAKRERNRLRTEGAGRRPAQPLAEGFSALEASAHRRTVGIIGETAPRGVISDDRRSITI